MYWTYLILFTIAVLVPDIVRDSFYSLPEKRAEELAIFLLGMAGFLIYVFKEHQFSIQEEEREKSQKKFYQTAKDLVESYNYIGEVNRKMDMLMDIALGISDRSSFSKVKEKEFYHSIVEAANSLTESRHSSLRFIDIKSGKTKKDFLVNNNKEAMNTIKNTELVEMGDNVNTKKIGDFLVISSAKNIDNVKSYIITKDYNKEKESASNNLEILKFLASQALFAYHYSERPKKS